MFETHLNMKYEYKIKIPLINSFKITQFTTSKFKTKLPLRVFVLTMTFVQPIQSFL